MAILSCVYRSVSGLPPPYARGARAILVPVRGTVLVKGTEFRGSGGVSYVVPEIYLTPGCHSRTRYPLPPWTHPNPFARTLRHTPPCMSGQKASPPSEVLTRGRRPNAPVLPFASLLSRHFGDLSHFWERIYTITLQYSNLGSLLTLEHLDAPWVRFR